MPRKRTLLIVGDSNILVSLPVIFVLEEVGGGSDVFVQVFLKGHALIHSGKWEGHDFFRKKFLKYPTQPPPPPIKYLPSLDAQQSKIFIKMPLGGSLKLLKSIRCLLRNV